MAPLNGPQDNHSFATTVRLDRFVEDGFVVVPGLLSADAVEEYVQRLELLSGRRRRSPTKSGAGWTEPDGVTKHHDFWRLILHQRLLSVVRSLLGNNVCFLQHTDLHVGFSSFNWHRDSANRSLGVGPDWDEADAPYRIVRVGVYLQAAGAAFRLGLIPGSHHKSDRRAIQSRSLAEGKTSWLGHVRRLITGRVPEAPGATWVSAAAGDAVIFDPRVLHTGTPVDGEKYSMFLAYGTPNRHFENHARYYRYQRTDLRYADLPKALADELTAAGLYHQVSPGAATVPTLPTALETLAMHNTRKR